MSRSPSPYAERTTAILAAADRLLRTLYLTCQRDRKADAYWLGIVARGIR